MQKRKEFRLLCLFEKLTCELPKMCFANCTQRRHWFSLQYARRHCSGWSVMYVARIGKMWQIFPSVQVIATPFWPASIRGLRSSHIQWCHVSYHVYWWLLGLNAANFKTSRYPIKTMAWDEGCPCKSLDSRVATGVRSLSTMSNLPVNSRQTLHLSIAYVVNISLFQLVLTAFYPEMRTWW